LRFFIGTERRNEVDGGRNYLISAIRVENKVLFFVRELVVELFLILPLEYEIQEWHRVDRDTPKRSHIYLKR
jgi:hypothetical protein